MLLLSITRAATLATATILFASTTAAAQGVGGLANTGDATVAKPGAVLFRVLNAWTRFDEKFTPDGKVVPLAAGLATDSLGPRQLPALAPLEAQLGTLTGDPGTRLTLGPLASVVNSRVVTTPISLEYGVTRRWSVGVMLPVVQTRSTVFAELNPSLGFANVGPNPGAFATSTQVQSTFTQAAEAVRTRVEQCTAAPADPGCAELLAREQEAEAFAQSADAFAGAVATVYGTSSAQPGQPFVPLAGSPLLLAVLQRSAALSDQYASLLGNTIDPPNLVGAAGPAAYQQLQQLLANPQFSQSDTIASIKRLGIGDVEVGAAYQITDQFADSTRVGSGLRLRAAARGVVRLPTGRPANPARLFDVGLGDGQTDVEGSVAVDARYGRWLGASAVGQYTAQLGGVTVRGAPNPMGNVLPVSSGNPMLWNPGNIVQFDLTPRFLLTPYFSIDGFYSLRWRGDDSYTPVNDGPVPAIFPISGPVTVPGATEQRVGFGFGYSSLSAYEKGTAPLPLDIRFLHTETVIASGGPAVKAFREVIQVRFYYRLRRR